MQMVMYKFSQPFSSGEVLNTKKKVHEIVNIIHIEIEYNFHREQRKIKRMH